MNERECFDIWAPPEAAWTEWAKPVLFAQMGAATGAPLGELVIPDDPWAPRDGKTALVVDMAGAAAVAFGVALARAGFRPVPLFNTSPGSNEVVPTGAL